MFEKSFENEIRHVWFKNDTKHEQIADSLNAVGNAYRKKQDYDKAVEYYEKSLNIRLNLFGNKDKDVADLCWNMGRCFINLESQIISTRESALRSKKKKLH